MSSEVTVALRRFRLVALGGTSRLLAALSSVVISLVIVRTQTPELWGEVVPFMLIIEFGFTLIGWGSSPYLVQAFSLQPSQIKFNWNRAAFSRSGLLVVFWAVLLLTTIPTLLMIYLIIWAAGRYIFQSFEPIAQVERNFIFSIFMEASALSLVVIPVLVAKNPLGAEHIILLLTASMVWKAGISLLFFRKWISYQRPDLTFFKDALPFFLLTVSSALQQRTDLYCVTFFLNEQETAEYQVFFNFLVFCQFVSSLLLSPFAKNIFRLSTTSVRKLERKFILAGIPVTLVAIGLVYVLVSYFYHFELSLFMYIMGYFYILMFYMYLLRNYEMGKAHLQSTVALYGFLGSAVNLVMCILMIPLFGKEGALLAGTIAQAFIVFLYYRTAIHAHAQS